MNGIGWMGRYRPLVSALVQHGNVCSHISRIELGSGIRLSSQEWQTLEYLIAYENEDLHMTAISRGLGIAQSSLTKYMNTLCRLKLVERYRIAGNRKSIIPKPTPAGRKLYAEAVEQIVGRNFIDFFRELESLPDESLEQVTRALKRLNLRMSMPKEPELVPLEEEWKKG